MRTQLLACTAPAATVTAMAGSDPLDVGAHLDRAARSVGCSQVTSTSSPRIRHGVVFDHVRRPVAVALVCFGSAAEATACAYGDAAGSVVGQRGPVLVVSSLSLAERLAVEPSTTR